MTAISMDKKYKTRGGKRVRILCTDLGCVHPVVFADETGMLVSTHADGRYYNDGTESKLDLIEEAPEITVEFWINIYQDNEHHIHLSKADADYHAVEERLECFHYKKTFPVKQGETK